MRWKGRRQSDNVIDSRGRRVARTAGAGMLLNFVGRRFGLKGILVLEFALVTAPFHTKRHVQWSRPDIEW